LIFVLARERAQAILMKAANDKHPLLRTNGFEGLVWLPDTLAEMAPKGLVDVNRAVRFVTAMAVGTRAVQGMAPYLEPLLLDSSDSVRASAIYALRSIGEPANPSPLAGFVMSDDPEIRANTYIVLGKLGNPSAIGLIRSSLGVGMQLANPMRVKLSELQAADVLVELGEQSEVEPLRAALFAPVEQGELTILACELLGEIGDGQARAMLQRLLTAPGRQQRPLEIRVAAAKALFVLDEVPSQQLESVIMVAVASDDSRLRVQAASALGVVPGAHAESVLLGMLDDVDPLVVTAAAASIARRSYKKMDP
jgi:HEAT repeat protein